MTQREHFERLMKQLRPNMPLDYNEQEGYYYHDMVSLAYQAYIASPKTRPTEPSKITKEQLDAMKIDTTDIVNHLRGIYAGAASRYPVTPLMMLAADEIEFLREKTRLLEQDNSNLYERDRYHMLEISRLELALADNKKPAEAG